MTLWRRFVARLLAFLRPHRADQELDREVASHLTLLEDEYQRRGMSPGDARVAARRAIGGIDQTKERHRDERSWLWLEDVRRDVPYALRALARNPSFTAAAVLTLGLGIGATTAIFSVVNAVLLRPLPYRDSDRLVRIAENISVGGPEGTRPTRRFGMTQDEFLEWRSRTKTLSLMAGVVGNPATMLTTAAGPVRVATARVSPVLFGMLGAQPLMGRVFVPEDERPDANAVLVSAVAWQRHFSSDPDVLGRSVVLNNAAYSVIGVMPADFDYPGNDIQFWTPLAPRAGQGQSGFGQIIARLEDGVSMEVATEEANAIGRAVRPDGLAFGFGAGPAPPPPAPSGTLGGTGRPAVAVSGQRFQVIGVKELLVASVRPAMHLLVASVCVVLLIVCANVANLLLARGTARQREIGIRLAIGAGRGRIVRQVLTESAVLAGAGGLGGVALAFGGVAMVKTLSTVDTPFFFQISANLTDGSILPRLDEIGVDVTVIAFAIGISLLTGIVFGLAPAFYLSRMNDAQAIGVGAASRSSGSQPSRARLRQALVVAQLVMATTLLVGAGLLVHSFVKLSTVNTGYDSSNVLTFQLVIPEQASTPHRLSLIEGLLARLRALPHVEGAGFTNIAPFLALTEYRGVFVPPGKSSAEMLADPLRPQTRSVSPGFLPALGARLLEGRWLNEGDGAGQPNVMLVNRALAQRYFGGQTPVGVLVRMYRTPEQPETWAIVGVVADVRQARLDEDPFPLVYLDTRQMIASGGQQPGNPFGFPSIAVRVAGDPTTVIPDVRAILGQLDPATGLDSIATLDELKYGSLVRPRFYAVLVGLFAAIAGVLAAIGIYGVLAYSVVQRTQEIGIRMALGAQRGEVLRVVLWQGMTLTAIGIAAGVLGAIGLTRYLTGMLYGLTPLDAPTYAAVAIVFAVVALVASYVPARRATLVDPVIALRCE